MSFVTLEELKDMNPAYHQNHGMTTDEVDIVNAMLQVIENTRTVEGPRPGDVVEYTDQYGDFHMRTHIDAIIDGELNICVNPYSPFVSGTESRLQFSTSGGPWANIPPNLIWKGRTLKTFKAWGRNGPCGNGAVGFLAQVNVWEYSVNEQPYSTRTHDKICLKIKAPEDTKQGYNGYKYVLRGDGLTAHRAMKTDAEFEAWKKTFRAVEGPLYTEWYDAILWVLKSEMHYIPLEEYHSIPNAIVDSCLSNGVIQECKRVYEGTTVTTYLPHQDSKIILTEGTPEYLYVQL